MLITTFGPPSGFTQCCLYLMRFVTDETLGGVDYLSAATLEQLREGWSTRAHPHAFFFADCPNRELVEVFLKLRNPSMIFLEEPDNVTGYIINERGMSWPWALRLTNQCLIAIGDLILSDTTLVLRREYELTLREFFRAVAQHFQFDVSDTQMAAVMTRAGLSIEHNLDEPLETVLRKKWLHSREPGRGLDELSKSDRQVIQTINMPIRTFITGRAVSNFVWPQELFISGDRANDILLDTIEMLGPARCLCYGPFLHLPPGNWEVALELEVSNNQSGNTFDIDIYHGEVIALESFQIPAFGRFMLKARFAIRDPREPIQVRIIMREGAIEGQLDVRSATVQALS